MQDTGPLLGQGLLQVEIKIAGLELNHIFGSFMQTKEPVILAKYWWSCTGFWAPGSGAPASKGSNRWVRIKPKRSIHADNGTCNKSEVLILIFLRRSLGQGSCKWSWKSLKQNPDTPNFAKNGVARNGEGWCLEHSVLGTGKLLGEGLLQAKIHLTREVWS